MEAAALLKGRDMGFTWIGSGQTREAVEAQAMGGGANTCLEWEMLTYCQKLRSAYGGDRNLDLAARSQAPHQTDHESVTTFQEPVNK